MKIVFFDAGDTILRPHPSFPEIFASVCKGAGHDVSPADAERAQEKLAPHLMDLEMDDDPDATPYAGSVFSADQSRRFWTYLYKRMMRELGIEDDALPALLFDKFTDTSSYKLFDDVVPVLHELREAGLRLGLISNFERWLEEMLAEMDVGHLFDTVTISGVAGVEKPDPAIFELALNEAGVAAADAVYVGDSPVLDAAPAARLGMEVVLIDRARRYPESPWPRIESLKELPEVISKL
jgi:putative hydrolase of the HAD superfamily